MKALHSLYGKKLWVLPILLLLALSLLNALDVNITRVSAVVSPYIAVVPETIEGVTLTPGTNFTVSICTDYVGTNDYLDYIWGYQFALSYNPNVLHGGINNTDTWTGDGATTIFSTTQESIVPDSEKIYVNQTLMTKPANYTIAYDPGEIAFTFTATDTWIGDNVTTVFNTTITPVVPDSEKVYVDQILMTKIYDYTIDYDTGEITFVTTPDLGVEIKVAYQYPPAVGAEIKAIYLYNGVVNGDLIVGGSAKFMPGPFDNVAGELSLTVGVFQEGGEVTSGPGTLANVTFTVVGYGTSDITIDSAPLSRLSKLVGWNWFGDPYDYDIINAAEQPDQIQHGYFDNRFSHDVSIDSVTVPPQAAVGSVVSVDVGVVNLGASDEVANVTVYYNSTYLDSENVTLLVGQDKVVSFNWDTVGLAEGFYTINATATVSGDGDLSNNWKTATVLLVEHDVAVTSILVTPDSAIPGTIIHINVTVVNIGAFEESANVTIRYNTKYLDSQNVTLAVSENKTVVFSWNTTGVATDIYTINATATVSGDGDLSDNWKTASVLISVHDVAILSMTVPPPVEAGELTIFYAVTRNRGLHDETFQVKATISFDTTVIKVQTQNVTLLGGANKEVGFSWNTTGVAPGSYTVKAEAILATDEDLTNNDLTKSILIIVPPIANFTFSPSLPTVDKTVTFDASLSYDPDPGGEIVSYAWNFGDGTTKIYVKDVNLTVTTTHAYDTVGTYTVNLTVTDGEGLTDTATAQVTVLLHDIAVTGVTPLPTTVKTGEPVSINVTVVNEGTEKETFNVTVYYDDTAIGTQTVTELASDASQSLTFNWDTTDVTAGTYTIKASATTVPGETDTTDNTYTDGDVTLEEAQAVDILPYAAAAGATAIVIAALAIYFLKIRKPKPT